ncbi:olfactory receptor 10A2-like [Protopterus annectens]|uniref:olfactory receptor 10A2-like n=1 Tax=Protopterus annectens TaxID=7888 RepID=UPI001CFA5100|nr:olfactory receptor 10A2-like [Protopterus annectens]
MTEPNLTMFHLLHFTEPNLTMFHLSHFSLEGFLWLHDWQSNIILFAVFIVIYVASLTENAMFLLLIGLDERLHSPMYLFVCNLAMLDISIPTVTVPKILHYLLTDDTTIEFVSCVTQMCFFIYLNVTECLVLAVMAYDRYHAICSPLYYSVIMTMKHTTQLSIFCWVPGLLIVFFHIYIVLNVPFCGPNTITAYFCEYTSLMMLACADVSSYSFVPLILALAFMSLILCFIIITYIKILLSVIKVKSRMGHKKAFSTCASHLLIIVLYIFVQASVLISRFVSDTSVSIQVLAGIIQNIVPPLVNPIIYCLKTKEIRISFLRVLNKIFTV